MNSSSPGLWHNAVTFSGTAPALALPADCAHMIAWCHRGDSTWPVAKPHPMAPPICFVDTWKIKRITFLSVNDQNSFLTPDVGTYNPPNGKF